MGVDGLMAGRCRKVEGLIAASMYEPLAPVDREVLDAHLDECIVCREALRGLESLMQEIPSDQPELDVDLLPTLRSELAGEVPGRVHTFRRRVVASLAAAAAVLMVFGVGVAAMSVQPSATTIAEKHAERRPSPLDRTFKQVDQLMEARFHSRAFLVLDTATRQFPNDPRTPEAVQLAADLAFDELHWYPEAHTALRTLRDRYTAQFDAEPANRKSLEMLEESYAITGDYLALHLLDTARVNGDFDGYEHVMSQYPGTYIASRALDEMPLALADEGDTIAALETLAETCNNPIAVAQVKLRLARTLDSEGAQRDRVRTLYEEAATSDSVALASVAKRALRELDE